MQQSSSPVSGRSLGRGAVIAYGILAAVTFPASSSAPTPLYHVYQQTMGLRPFDITVIFACYAFSLLAALLTVGSLSDHVGRRPLVLSALVLNALAMTMFAAADSTAMLVGARMVQGLAAGIAIPTIGAMILDVDRARGPLFNSLTPFIGLFIGVVGAAALVSFAPLPRQLVYLILLVVSVAEIAVLAIVPETTSRRPGALASLRPSIHVPAKAVSALWRTSPVNIAGWALGGYYLSLMPALVSTAAGISSPFVGGAVVATLMLVATAAVLASQKMAARHMLQIGTISLIVGIAITAVGIHGQYVWQLFLGTAIVGIGFGANFAAILRIVLPLAEARDRAGLLSAFFVESYLAFALPAIAAGLTVPYYGLAAVSYGFFAVVVALAVVSLIAARRIHVVPALH